MRILYCFRNESDEVGEDCSLSTAEVNVNIFQQIVNIFFSEVVNGDKYVLDKLDEQISVHVDGDEAFEEEEDVDYKKVAIDYQGLIDKDSHTDDILKDLLDLPGKNRSKVYAKNI